MSSDNPEVSSNGTTDLDRQSSHQAETGATDKQSGTSGDSARRPATVLVRGETVSADAPKVHASAPALDDKNKSSAKTVSEAKVKLQARLPALEDDREIAVQKNQVVARDGKADLAFSGTLLASAAPESAPTGRWEEYRIYETSGGKHVFSKIHRSVSAQDEDASEAEIFDPSPSSMPSQLLRSARDLTRSEPITWKDAAVDFFGYEPLAKVLYRKLGTQFEEHVV